MDSAGEEVDTNHLKECSSDVFLFVCLVWGFSNQYLTCSQENSLAINKTTNRIGQVMDLNWGKKKLKLKRN